jgi:hypothetical protein
MNALYKGGHETETRHSNVCLYIYGMRDTPAFMMKGDALLTTRVALT